MLFASHYKLGPVNQYLEGQQLRTQSHDMNLNLSQLEPHYIPRSGIHLHLIRHGIKSLYCYSSHDPRTLVHFFHGSRFHGKLGLDLYILREQSEVCKWAPKVLAPLRSCFPRPSWTPGYVRDLGCFFGSLIFPLSLPIMLAQPERLSFYQGSSLILAKIPFYYYGTLLPHIN